MQCGGEKTIGATVQPLDAALLCRDRDARERERRERERTRNLDLSLVLSLSLTHTLGAKPRACQYFELNV